MSSIFIGHVRYATQGDNTYQNTHPFVRTFRDREVALAHNGTQRPVMERRDLKFDPLGETDSEYLFCSQDCQTKESVLLILKQLRVSFVNSTRLALWIYFFQRGVVFIAIATRMAIKGFT